MATNEETPEDAGSDNDDIAAHDDEPMEVDDEETEKKDVSEALLSFVSLKR